MSGGSVGNHEVPRYLVMVQCVDCGAKQLLMLAASTYTRKAVDGLCSILANREPRSIVSPVGCCAVCRGRIECTVAVHGIVDPEKPYSCRQCSTPLAFEGFCTVACHTAADGSGAPSPASEMTVSLSMRGGVKSYPGPQR